MSTSTVALTPAAGRILVLPNEPESVSPGGIVLPQQSQGKPTSGRVVAVGIGRRLENGNRTEPEFSEGCTVFYGVYAGADIEYEGETYKVLAESDVLAVVE